MKKIICICICICICSSFGCNRTADNVSPAPQSLNASAPVPQSSNAPASELQPTPAPTVQSNLDIALFDEFCGKGNGVPYYCHSSLSLVVNVILAYFSVYGGNLSKFFGILKMVSAFSFPVHVALTNPSFLSKSKLSLTALAADTFISVCNLIVKDPLFNGHFVFLQPILEIVRYFRYPHIYSIYSIK